MSGNRNLPEVFIRAFYGEREALEGRGSHGGYRFTAGEYRRFWRSSACLRMRSSIAAMSSPSCSRWSRKTPRVSTATELEPELGGQACFLLQTARLYSAHAHAAS